MIPYGFTLKGEMVTNENIDKFHGNTRVIVTALWFSHEGLKHLNKQEAKRISDIRR